MNAGIVAYYDHMTGHYNAYARGTHGWHFGLWEPGTNGAADALHNSNRWLTADAGLDANARVLDVGCGDGGFAVWAARTFGCRVTGITVVPRHLEDGARLAAEAGVGDRCDFRLMDMNALDFAPGSFDLVVNQETVCYAADKAEYLRSVRRILRPGGRWQMIDAILPDEPLIAPLDADYAALLELWHMASFVPAPAWEQAIAAAGMERVTAEDLTPRAAKTARHILFVCRTLQVARHLGVLRLIHWDAAYRDALRRHVDAGALITRGMRDGWIRLYGLRVRAPG